MNFVMSKGFRIAMAVFITAVVLAPLLLMVATAFKADEQQILFDLGSFKAFWVNPWEMSLVNFTEVLSDKQAPFLWFMFNSLVITASIVILGIFVNSACAYALARLRFKGRGVLLAVIVALIIIPFEELAVPLLLMVNRVGMTETHISQIIPFIAHPFSIFLFYQFFSKLPKDIDEAAYIEGASSFQIYWKIILPLSLPVIATVAILQSLEYWNAFLWPLMVNQSTFARPVSVALAQFFGTPPYIWGNIMAFSLMMSLPVLILYLAFQRWFIQSVVAAAVK
jgi:multiple sugar transport system permease protein